MTRPEFSLTGEFGGFPFIDDQFDSNKFLTAIASVRIARSKPEPVGASDITNAKLNYFLQPSAALDLYSTGPDKVDLNASDLPESQLAQIEQALNDLVLVRPEWKPLVRLPLKYMRMERDHVISASTDAVPQHVFLSDRAFATPHELREQILHETCHNWLYLVDELWRLHWTKSRAMFMLPSGTGNRTPGEVLGASHVAATLRRYYLANDSTSEWSTRIRDLGAYLKGCQELLTLAMPCFTSLGRELAARLGEEGDD